jgi:serine/threonine protein kinase
VAIHHGAASIPLETARGNIVLPLWSGSYWLHDTRAHEDSPRRARSRAATTMVPAQPSAVEATMTETSTCPACGAPVPKDAARCPACGTSLADGAEQADGWEAVRRQLEEATTGEFEVLRELGRGGMAAVYLARDLALGRNVAIKVMAPGLLMGPGMVDRFRQEAVTVANLHHPNIITIHTVRQAETLHFFVMELVDGSSLEEVLRRSEPIPMAVIQAILYQVGTGLAHAHRRGVIHRDIKPANVLLDGDGNAIVTDFGIAKVTTATNLTQTGFTVGTPSYMSPEQCLARELSGASDQYSLGVVAYEMLVGRAPFTGSHFEIMQAHASAPVPGIRQQRPDCPAELEAAVLRMLSKEPGDRFPTVAEAIEAVGGYLPGPTDPLRMALVRLVKPDAAAPTEVWSPVGPIPSRSPSPAPALPAAPEGSAHRRHPRLPLFLWGVTGLAAIVALAVVLARGWPEQDATPLASELPDVASISFPSPVESLRVGEAVRVRARLQDAGGEDLEGWEVAWSSGDSRVVSVEGFDEEAMLRGLAPGTAAVHASAGGVRESLSMVVSAPVQARAPEPEPVDRGVVGGGMADPEVAEPVRRVESLSVEQPFDPLVAGGTAVLRALVTAEPPGFRGEGGILWTSSNPAVASVSASGGDSAVVALLTGGDAVLTARAGSAQGTLALRISPAPPAVTVTLSQASVTFQAVEGGTTPPEQTVRVTVSGDGNPLLGVVHYEGTTRDWLRASLGGGSGQETVLTLRAEAGGLASGSHRARVPVEAGGQIRQLEIRLEVAPRPVSTAVEPTPAAEREIGELLSAYAGAINAKNETRVRELYPSITQDGIRDLMRIQQSDIFQVVPLSGTLRAGAQARSLYIDVSAGIVPRTGRGETRRMTYTVGRGDAGWYIVGVRAAG